MCRHDDCAYRADGGREPRRAIRHVLLRHVHVRSIPLVLHLPSLIICLRFLPISTSWAWLSCNLAGSNKRAAGTAIVYSIGNIGGAISGQIYRAEWAPRYVQGHAINLGCYVLAIVAGLALWWSYRRDNVLRDRENGRKVTSLDGMLGEDLGDLGDR